MYRKTGIAAYAVSERNILADLDFPFIIKLRWAFQTKSKLFLVFDFFENGDLQSVLDKEIKFKEERARIYFAEVLVALQYLHNKNIIYRDLKPENILIDNSGHLVLTDFGIAKDLGMRTDSNTFCGSTQYMSPEVLQ